MRPLLAALMSLLVLSAPLAAQTLTNAERDRARTHNRMGWDALRAEQYPAAIKSFQAAIDIRPDYEYAYYGLGRAYLASRRFVEAITVLERCRDLYKAQGSKQFSSIQDAQRHREDRVLEIDEQIRLLRTGPQTVATQDLARQYDTIKRDLQEAIRRNQGLTIDATVPPFVLLSLGSAYFRGNRPTDAEREYRAAIDADPRLGEAHNNLAVVYLQSGKFEDASRSLASAKKAGFKVNPELEKAIKEKRP
jgi:tetratricopeptide (TPR) repeat protein